MDATEYNKNQPESGEIGGISCADGCYLINLKPKHHRN